MRKKQRTRLVGKGAGAGTVLLCVVGMGGAARAQSVLRPPPMTYSATPPAVQEMQEQGMGYVGRGENTLTLPSPADFLTWGPAVLHPHFNYQLSESGGVQATPGNSENSLVQTFSPGVLAVIGTHLTLDYTPTITFYSDKNLQDTVDHSVSLSWGNAYGDWTMGASQSASYSFDPLIETGSQTTTESYNTSLSASYAINSYMSVDFSANQSIQDASGAVAASPTNTLQLNSSSSWSTMEWLNFQVWPRLNVAVGTGAGYDQVSEGPNMSHEALQGRISWRATDKLSLSVNGGAEDRQYIGAGVPDEINPLYGASIAYQPFDSTSLSLSLSRATSVSLFQDQTTDSTSLGVSLTQRLFQKYSLQADFSYNQVDYLQTLAHVFSIARTDTTYAMDVRLSRSFFTRMSGSVFYSYTQNSSTGQSFNLSTWQTGFSFNYTF